MANDYATQAMSGIRAILISDPNFNIAVPGGVSEDPLPSVALPHVRYGRVEVPADDTDGTQGADVQMGLEVHTRPGDGGRVQALRICQIISLILHRQPEKLILTDLHAVDVEVQTFSARRATDGETHSATLAMRVQLQA